MEIANDGLEFDSIDKFAWKQFLATRAGLRLIPKVAEHAPQLLGAGDTNAILIKSGELRGFQLAIQTLLSLAEPPAKETPTAPTPYPNLTDDAAWNDGQTLTKKPTPHA